MLVMQLLPEKILKENKKFDFADAVRICSTARARARLVPAGSVGEALSLSHTRASSQGPSTEK